jgi:cation:H+ antiporter
MVVVAKAGDLFVDSARRIAKTLGISQMAIALTLIAFATSAPEFFTSLIAAALGNVGISYGNVVGSNIINITPILALAAIFGAASVGKRGTSDALFMLTTGLVLVLFSFDGVIAPAEGFLLLILFVAFVALVARGEKQEATIRRPTRSERLGKLALIFTIGTIGLLLGARVLVYGGAGIAEQALMAAGLERLEAEAAVGFTVVALGTSLPELATIVISIRKKLHEISIGTIIGSNVFNIGLIVGAASFACAATGASLEVDSQAIYFSNPVMLLSMVLLASFLWGRRRMARWQGWALLLLYAAYLLGVAMFYAS